MRYVFGIYKELIKWDLQRKSDTIVLYRSIYGMSLFTNLNKAYLT